MNGNHASDGKNRWKQEFNEFLSAPDTAPPQGLSREVLSRVSHDLNPSGARVFARLAGVHLVVGTATLLICPQFGFSLSGRHGVMHFLMQWGPVICTLLCGAIFVGASVLASVFVLRPEEVRVLRKNRFLQSGVLASLSLGVFVSFGASVVLTLGMVWILGSMLAALASLELGWLARTRVASRW